MKRYILPLSVVAMGMGLWVGVVEAVDLTWDANGTGDGQTDGGGTWLNPDQWWDGGANAAWNSGTPDTAIIGNGGSGGTITLGAVTAGNVTFGSFSGTYTLGGDSGSTLDQSAGVTTTTNSGNVTFSKKISGAGGLTVNNAAGKILILASGQGDPSSYTGPTVVTGGILQIGTGWQNSQSIPGGISSSAGTTGSNLELNGGTITISYYLRRPLGSGPGQLQITGGASGFNHWQGDTYGRIAISNSANFELVWGSEFFKPDVFVLNEEAASPQQVVNIVNKIDLNGATRTVACNSTRSVSGGYVNGNNGDMATAGGRLTGLIRNTGSTPAGVTKIGPGVLQLTAANTYDGDTTISEGSLELINSNVLPDGAALRLAEGATVSLRAGVDETVLHLYRGSKPVAAGTWGSSASPAVNLDDTYFTGEGIITVLASPVPAGGILIVR
jgi:fibronectin-binding autotransporter adhesin